MNIAVNVTSQREEQEKEMIAFLEKMAMDHIVLNVGHTKMGALERRVRNEDHMEVQN